MEKANLQVIATELQNFKSTWHSELKHNTGLLRFLSDFRVWFIIKHISKLEYCMPSHPGTFPVLPSYPSISSSSPSVIFLLAFLPPTLNANFFFDSLPLSPLLCPPLQALPPNISPHSPFLQFLQLQIACITFHLKLEFQSYVYNNIIALYFYVNCNRQFLFMQTLVNERIPILFYSMLIWCPDTKTGGGGGGGDDICFNLVESIRGVAQEGLCYISFRSLGF